MTRARAAAIRNCANRAFGIGARFPERSERGERAKVQAVRFGRTVRGRVESASAFSYPFDNIGFQLYPLNLNVECIMPGTSIVHGYNFTLP